MINVGIIGAAGYTGGELLRILLHHSGVDIQFVHSNSQAGKSVCDLHTDLIGDTDLVFTSTLDFSKTELVFLCVSHGEAKKIVGQIPESVKIIDLSQDFRISNKTEKRAFVYGLPELNKEAIKTAKNIANPGCFATAIQLALLPLAAQNLLQSEINITATTGSTGAGQSLSESVHFSWRDHNLSVYKAFTHQHIAEIKQSITGVQPAFNKSLIMIPQRGAFTRGIFSQLVIDTEKSEAELNSIYTKFYENHPFVFVSSKSIDLKQVINTNKCLLHLQKHENKLVVLSIIDNLLKGASGQAVQNMNLMFGLDEREGLKLKASAF